jgi:acetyltransferase-like isoleucine patch superfamily enzyme
MSAPYLEHDWFPRPLPSNVRIGPRSWLYSAYAFLHCRSQAPCCVQIGSDSGVYHGSFFELGPEGRVEIGDFCTLVGATICTNGRVVIEDYAFIAHEVFLADRFAPVPFEPGARTLRAGPAIRIGKNAWIGARAVLLQGADLGEGSIVGAATVVDTAVPPFAIVAGDPARIVGWARPDRQPANEQPPSGGGE